MNKKYIEIVLSILLLPLVLLPLLAHWDTNNNFNNLANHNYGKNLMNTLEPNSIFMTEGGDNQVFTSAYNQMAEFLRPDVRIYDQKGNVFYRIYGDFRYMSGQEINIKRDLVDFEIYKRGRPVYLTWRRNPPINVCGDWFLKRYGILYKVVDLKYRILEDLEADVELTIDRAHSLIKSYYQPRAVMNKLKTNLKNIEKWYSNALLSGRLHFINDEERKRLVGNIFLYKDYIKMALARDVNKGFSLKILKELQNSGYLKIRGNKIVFIKDIPFPLVKDFWKKYKFDYKKVKNSSKWDYLTREILTNYNFYLAEYKRQRIAFYKRQLAFYKRKLKRVFGKDKINTQDKIKWLNNKIKELRKEEEECYLNAEHYGFDMGPIHHNLGTIYLQRGNRKKAFELFTKGVKVNKYSFQTIYSYIILSLQIAKENKDPEVGRKALIEAKELCKEVYQKIRAFKRMPKGGYEKHPHYIRFKRLEKGLIDSRMRVPTKKIEGLKKQVENSPDNISLLAKYLNTLYQRHDYKGVISTFEKAPKGKWKNAQLVYYYGLCLQMTGKIDDSITVLTRLKTDFPEYFLGVFRLAQIYQQLKKDPQTALSLYKEILLIDQDSVKNKYKAFAGLLPRIKAMCQQQIKRIEGQ